MAKTKISRRLVVNSLIDMLEAGRSEKEVAETLAAYLIENRQTRDLKLYLRDLELATENRFDLTTVYVASARKLTPKTRKEVEQLVKTARNVKNVEMVESIDESLVGGIVVKTADAELDGSVRTKLRKLRSI